MTRTLAYLPIVIPEDQVASAARRTGCAIVGFGRRRFQRQKWVKRARSRQLSKQIDRLDAIAALVLHAVDRAADAMELQFAVEIAARASPLLPAPENVAARQRQGEAAEGCDRQAGRAVAEARPGRPRAAPEGRAAAAPRDTAGDPGKAEGRRMNDAEKAATRGGAKTKPSYRPHNFDRILDQF